MDHALDQALVRTILEHAADYPWRLQGVGLLALRLDDRREHRLHVWDPDGGDGDPPIHDHPYDFTSTVIVGELTNTRYVEDPTGDEYCRERYSPENEERPANRHGAPGRHLDHASAPAIATTSSPTSCTAAARSRAPSPSSAAPGVDRPELTVCRRPGAPWVSGQARPATPDEVTRITTAALDLFGAAPASCPI